MIKYIYDESGNIVTTYTYDAWGRQVSVTGSNVTLGNLNPIRYKSYFYDSDTGFYYLETRFYDPTVGRFISPDDPAYLGASGSVLGWNLYSYCENEPVGMLDLTGNWLARVVSAAVLASALSIVSIVTIRIVNQILKTLGVKIGKNQKNIAWIPIFNVTRDFWERIRRLFQ